MERVARKKMDITGEMVSEEQYETYAYDDVADDEECFHGVFDSDRRKSMQVD